MPHRVYRYLKGTAETGVVVVINLDEVRLPNGQFNLALVKSVGRAGADHAGETSDARSCSGWICATTS